MLAFAAVLAYLLVVALKLARLEPELTELEAFGMASRPAEEATPQPAGSDQAAGLRSFAIRGRRADAIFSELTRHLDGAPMTPNDVIHRASDVTEVSRADQAGTSSRRFAVIALSSSSNESANFWTPSFSSVRVTSS